MQYNVLFKCYSYTIYNMYNLHCISILARKYKLKTVIGNYCNTIACTRLYHNLR